MGKRHFSFLTGNSPEQPSSFSRLPPLDIPSQTPHHPLITSSSLNHSYNEISNGTRINKQSTPETSMTDNQITEYRDKFRPFDSYHWDNSEGAYRTRTNSVGEVTDNCNGTDWLRESNDRQATALSYEKRGLSGHFCVTGSSIGDHFEDNGEVDSLTTHGEDDKNEGHMIGSYLSSLYDDWYDIPIQGRKWAEEEKAFQKHRWNGDIGNYSHECPRFKEWSILDR